MRRRFEERIRRFSCSPAESGVIRLARDGCAFGLTFYGPLFNRLQIVGHLLVLGRRRCRRVAAQNAQDLLAGLQRTMGLRMRSVDGQDALTVRMRRTVNRNDAVGRAVERYGVRYGND